MLAIEKHLSKLAKYCGFHEPGERGLDPMQETKKAINQETKGAVPLSDCMLYDYFDEVSGIAFNKGSIGFFFEVNSLVGSESGIEKNLTMFFNEELPVGGYLQFLVVASHNLNNILDIWEKDRQYGGKALERLTKYKRHFIESNSKDFKNASDGRLARDYRTYISFSCSEVSDNKIEEIIKFKQKLYNKLKAENFNPIRCGADELISVARDCIQMNMDTHSKHTRYSILNDINEQIVKGNDSTVEEDRIIHHDTGMVSKVFAPQELPESFSLVEMINLIGDEYKAIPARFVICYAIANNLGVKGTSTLLSRGTRVINAASKAYTKNDLVVHEEANKWIQVKAIHKKGEIFLSESMQVMITAPEDNIDTAEEVLKSIYNSHDWKLGICSKIQRIASLAMLPMMSVGYWKMLKFFKLTRNALSGEVVAKLPLQGEWKGVPKSGVLLVGRRGQLFNFNPFHRVGGGGNYNICMMAPSGSGKSFLLQGLAESMMALDVAMFVMDIGGSYKNITHLLDGEMVRFNKDNKISLNPFAALSNSGTVYAKALELMAKGKKASDISDITGLSLEKIEALKYGKSNATNEEKESDAIEVLEVSSNHNKKLKHFVTKDSIIYAKSMVAAMCDCSGDSRKVALIERAIIEGIAEHGNSLDITKMALVLEELKNKKNEPVEGASAMADSLYPYTEGGIHGRFFGAGEEASFKEMLTVFELEELVNDEALLAVVLQVVLMQITMQFLCGDRTRRFMLIVDEAWLILDYAAFFLERFARTVRKYGGSLVVCTQDLSSFTNISGTRKSQAAVLESSTWKMILSQKEEGLETFAKSKAYEKHMGLISSLRKCSSNKFSEVLISTNGVNVVGRFSADPYSTALFSTEQEDFNFLLKQEKAGVSKHRATVMLSERYGTLPDGGTDVK